MDPWIVCSEIGWSTSKSVMPQPLNVSDAAVSGRGLAIVDALVKRWWVEDQRGRTTVHVRIPLGQDDEAAS